MQKKLILYKIKILRKILFKTLQKTLRNLHTQKQHKIIIVLKQSLQQKPQQTQNQLQQHQQHPHQQTTLVVQTIRQVKIALQVIVVHLQMRQINKRQALHLKQQQM